MMKYILNFSIIFLVFLFLAGCNPRNENMIRPPVRNKKDPRDVRDISKMVDDMWKNVNARSKSMSMACDKFKIPKEEKIKLLKATFDAGDKAVADVVNSNYTIDFDPKYPDFPH